ncbi:MAG TPA: hypothetical protein VKR58_03845, partial [Aquella sp.]|nr:hypothetical protein [Aquella sp.]
TLSAKVGSLVDLIGEGANGEHVHFYNNNWVYNGNSESTRPADRWTLVIAPKNGEAETVDLDCFITGATPPERTSISSSGSLVSNSSGGSKVTTTPSNEGK